MNEQQETIKQEQPSMSPFCEALMGFTDKIKNQCTPTDASIIICSDSKALATWHSGHYADVLRMLYELMRKDDQYAALITEASLLYSRHVLGNKVPTFPTIVKPIKQTQS